MISAFFRAFGLFLLGIPVTIAGLFAVAIGIPFRRAEGDPIPYSQYPELGSWQRLLLPAWLLPWDNAFDGLLGDKRGWWANYCRENYNKPETSFYSMWQWAAIRNPANYWSRVMCGVDVSTCLIEKIAGDDVVTESAGLFEWQLLKATRLTDGKIFPRFLMFMPWWFRHDKAVMVDIGWKIKLSHRDVKPTDEEKDRLKGSVFTMSPWKSA